MVATANPDWMDTTKGAFLHFGVVLGLALMIMFNWPEIYRVFVYINALIVLAYARPLWQDRTFRMTAATIFAFPLLLTLLHMMTEGHPQLVKEARHVWLAGFICMSVLTLLRKHASTLRPYLASSLVWLLIIYVLVQVTALALVHRPYGTTKNPHYLALYSSLSIPVALYLLITMRSRLRLALLPALLLLGSLILHTSSRPAWLALMLTGLLCLVFLKGSQRLIAGLLVVGLPLLLYVANVADFGSRSADLAENISKEERVVIWQDAWHMQRSSSPFQWIVGHGLDSFKKDFRSFSRFHSQIDFNSPHNSFMDVLYTSGIVGLALCLWLYYWIYLRLRVLSKGDTGQRKFAIALIAVVTLNAMFIGITIPFFTHYNTFTLAIVVALLLYLKERNNREA